MDLLKRVGAPTDLSTLILIQGDKHYIYTAAVLRTFALLDWPHRALAAGYILPESVSRPPCDAPRRATPGHAHGRASRWPSPHRLLPGAGA